MPSPTGPAETPPLTTAVVRNEFAVVHVAIRVTPRGAMTLVIREADSGEEIALDALELEALVRADHEFFRELLTT